MGFKPAHRKIAFHYKLQPGIISYQSNDTFPRYLIIGMSVSCHVFELGPPCSARFFIEEFYPKRSS